MMLRFCLLAALVVFSFVGSTAADEKADKAKAAAKAAEAEAAKIAGTWIPVSGMQNGKAFSKDSLKGKSLTFTGKEFPGHIVSLVPYLPEKTFNAALVHWSVNPEMTPHAISFQRSNGLKGSYYPGIYELKGDALTLCVDFTPSPDGPPSRKRPTKFAAPKGSPFTLITFKREK